MNGVRRQQPVDLVRPDDFWRNADLDPIPGQSPRCIFGEDQLAKTALRVLQRHGHRVPAIEDDRPVRVKASVAVAPCWPWRGGAAFLGFSTAPEWRFCCAIAHRRLVSWAPDNGNFGFKRSKIAIVRSP